MTKFEDGMQKTAIHDLYTGLLRDNMVVDRVDYNYGGVLYKIWIYHIDDIAKHGITAVYLRNKGNT